jgi:hypothetical protein
MKKAAVGFRVHSGWTALVAVSVEKDVPIVISRQRLRLVKTFSYRFRQPFHTAEKMPFADAGKFISKVQKDAEGIAHRALRVTQVDLKRQGYQLYCSALLLASGKPLPQLEKILQSHALIHTADGELFRQVLLRACNRCGVQIACTRERELLELCTQAFSVPAPELQRRVTELGRSFGSPWSQDEKFATLAAWLVLATDDRLVLADQ